MPVTTIMVPLSAYDWSDPLNLDAIAFETSIALLNHFGQDGVDLSVRLFYALSTYDAEVVNGGHSQLIYNLRVLKRLWVIDEARNGALTIAAIELSWLMNDFIRWLHAHHVEALGQTGFEGGRAHELDVLDERYYDLDHVLADNVTTVVKSRNDPTETALVSAFSDEIRGISKVAALRILWLKRSGIVEAVDDATYQDYIRKIGGRPT